MARGKLDVQKKQHRERSQPLKRQRLGLLEKHKDYVLRARDYHSKEDRIKRLREKAAGRNRDEFYFGMINSRTERGVHVQSRGNKALETDLVRLLKTQDAGYVRTQRAMEEKRVQRLKERLGARVDLTGDVESSMPEDGAGEGDPLRAELVSLLQQDHSAIGAVHPKHGDDEDMIPAVGPSRKHTLFMDSVEAVQLYTPLTKKKGKCRAILSQQGEDADVDGSSPSDDLPKLLAILKSRLRRLRTLQRAEREMDMIRALMGNGSKQPIGGPPKKRKLLETGRDLSWYDKLDRNEMLELEEERAKKEKASEGIKTGAKVWKWKAERKR